jgi:HSP90 family molecular chaperone
MSRDEITDNLGTIAKSGSSEFVKKLQQEGGATGDN